MKGCLQMIGLLVGAFLFLFVVIAVTGNHDKPKSTVTRASATQSGGLGGIAPLGKTALATVQAQAQVAAKATVVVATPQPTVAPPTATPMPTTVPILSVEQIKAKAGRVTYEELMRTPEKFQGVPIRFTGEVLQTGTEDPWFAEPYGWLRIQIESEEINSHAVLVYWNHDHRILEGDTVEVYGLGNGRWSYETVMGNEMTIPKIDGRAVTVLDEE